MNEEIIKKIMIMLIEANQNCNKAAAGFDEGYYSGMADAFEKVLELIKK